MNFCYKKEAAERQKLCQPSDSQAANTSKIQKKEQTKKSHMQSMNEFVARFRILATFGRWPKTKKTTRKRQLKDSAIESATLKI